MQILLPGRLAKVRTNPVSGAMTVEEALERMLAGTGLTARKTGPETWTIVRAPAAQTSRNTDADAQEAEPVPSEIVVTGTHIQGSTPASPVHVVRRADIARAGFTQPGEILASLPENFTGGQNPGVFGVQGVNGGTSATSAQTANLRGLGQNATLTLVNGRRFAYDTTSNAVDLSVIPMAAIERVEVETDGASALYGSDAVGGVVNFILRKRYVGAELSTTLTDPIGSGGFGQEYSALAGVAWQSGNVLGSFEYSHDAELLASDRDFAAAAADPNTLYPRLRRKSGFASLTQQLTPWLEAEVQGLYTDRDTRYHQTTGAVGSISDYGTEQYGGTASLNARLGASWHASLAGTYARTRSDGTTIIALLPAGTVLVSNKTQQRTSLTDIDFLADGTLATLPSGDLKVAVGASYRRETLFANLSTIPTDEARTIKAVFGEAVLPLVRPSADRPLLNTLELSAALRYEEYSTFGSTTNPKVGVVYVPIQGLRLKGSWGRSFRAPTLAQQSGLSTPILYPASRFGITSPATATVLLGNGANVISQLRPEHATTWTVTAEFEPTALPGLRASASYYHIAYRDKIAQPFTNPLVALSDPAYADFVTASPSAAFQQNVIALSSAPLNNITGQAYVPGNVIAFVDNYYRNLSSQTAHGVDLRLGYGVDSGIGHFDVDGSASFLTLDRVVLAGSPEQRISGTIFNPPSSRFRLALSWAKDIFASSVFLNHSAGFTDNVALPQQHVDAWSTVDLRLSIATPKGRGVLDGTRLAVGVQNLFNQDPPLVRTTSTVVAGMGYDSANASAFGRTLRLTLTRSW